ncbi:MAG: pilus assembly protein PilM [bacterium]
MFFLSPKDVSVSLDIGSHSVKLVKIERGKKVKVLNAVKILLPQDLIRGSFVNENIREQKVFTEKIKELFLNSGLNDKETVIGIPDTSARSIFLELENVPGNKEDAKELIIWKLKKDIDSNLDKNFAIDYQILNKEIKEKKSFYQLFVVLINKKILAEYEESLKQAGLKPVLTALSSFGLVNFFNFFGKSSGNFLIVNLGYQVTTLLIIKDQKLDFIRSIENFNSIKSAQGDFAREISVSLRYYENKTGGAPIEKIFLTGGPASFKDIDVFFKSAFHLDTFRINQVERINLVRNIAMDDILTYASAIGLLI